VGSAGYAGLYQFSRLSLRSTYPHQVSKVGQRIPATQLAKQHAGLLAQVKAPLLPTFILARGNEIVIIAAGLGGWRNRVLPHIPGVLSGEWPRHSGTHQ